MPKFLNCDIENPAKVTVARLKQIIKAQVGNTCLVLSKNAPYWANNDQIKYLEQAKDMVVEGLYKNVRVTEAQKKSLDNWIDGFRETYLR